MHTHSIHVSLAQSHTVTVTHIHLHTHTHTHTTLRQSGHSLGHSESVCKREVEMSLTEKQMTSVASNTPSICVCMCVCACVYVCVCVCAWCLCYGIPVCLPGSKGLNACMQKKRGLSFSPLCVLLCLRSPLSHSILRK